jgi:DNA-binding XRE family transcriptional regulator
MNLQIIKSQDGRPEYVLLPLIVYNNLRSQIDRAVSRLNEDDYVSFNVADYIDNPIAVARIKAHISQQRLAKLMGVTQAYISKIENQKNVSAKIIEKVGFALSKHKRSGQTK